MLGEQGPGQGGTSGRRPSLEEVKEPKRPTARMTCIAFAEGSAILAAGTSTGHVNIYR